MNWRFTLPALRLLVFIGLAACVPSPVISTAEPPGTPTLPSGAPTVLPAHQPTLSQPSPVDQAPKEESQQGQGDGDQILVAPTLAPTATPGVIYSVVEQVVEATNLEETSFIGLYAADWIDRAISFLLVLLVVTLVARLIFSISIKIARGTATPYDEIYLKSIQSTFRWLIFIIILYIATTRLQLLRVESYAGQLEFGVTAASAAVPRPGLIAKGLVEAFEQLRRRSRHR